MGNSKENNIKRTSGPIRDKVLSSKVIEEEHYTFKWHRKILHLTFSLFGFALLFFPEYSTQTGVILGILTLLMFFLDTLRLSLPGFNKFAYSLFGSLLINRDQNRYSSATFYLIGSCLVTIIFSPQIAGLGIIFLGIGDVAASYGGTRFKAKFPYTFPKSHKTYIGFLFFIISTTIIGLIGGFPIMPLLVASIVSALAEVYITVIDDNFVIPLVGSIVFWIFY
jgi:dolichol kinase